MRAETRHQLKQDRFSKATIEAAEATMHWSQEHQGKLIVAAIAVLIVAGIVFGGWYYINSQDEKASLEFTDAVRTMDAQLRPPGTPAQPSIQSFESVADRATAARKKFQAIADKYPQTKTGKMARYFVGVTSAQLGDYVTAERNLQETANSSNAQLASLGKFALASVYREEKKDSQATDLYKQLIDKPTELVSKVQAQLELASLYESEQKTTDAKKIYQEIEKENPQSEVSSIAQRKLADLK
ncbi:MAG: tetratricopeptide repeat protein [Terriglobales bacterium]